MASKNKLVVLILEGISNKLLSAWRNRLPNLDNLLSRNGGILHTGFVPYEAPNLLTAFTGVTPGNHGVYSYWHVHNYDYIPKTWDAVDIEVPMLWQMTGMEKVEMGLMNLFCTYPPYQIRGKMISYLQQPSLRGCYPKDYIKELLRKGYKYTSDVFVGLGYGQDKPISGTNRTPRDEYYRLFKETEIARTEIILDMMNMCDVVIANLTIIDRLSHFFWHEVEAGSPFDEEETLLFKAYSLMDRIAGKIADEMPTDANLLIFSEMGYGPLINFISINKYLETNKLLVCRHNVNEWSKTIAFESVQGAHGVNINLHGKYRDGVVQERDYKNIRREVMDCLKSLINPKTCLPMFSHVQERENIYRGKKVKDAPDIVVEMADNRFVPMGDAYWSSKVHRKNQSGWHRKDGFWTGYGSAFTGIKRDASVLDIAPTTLGLLGVESDIRFEGQSMLEAVNINFDKKIKEKNIYVNEE